MLAVCSVRTLGSFVSVIYTVCLQRIRKQGSQYKERVNRKARKVCNIVGVYLESCNKTATENSNCNPLYHTQLTHESAHHLVDEELHLLHITAEAAGADLGALGVQHHCAQVGVTVRSNAVRLGCTHALAEIAHTQVRFFVGLWLEGWCGTKGHKREKRRK